MDRSPSAHSPDVRESRPSFRKPANEASRRNYRRHSPSSSRSCSPSSGGWKRDRSPSYQEDGVSKKGRNVDADSGKGREDARFRRATDGSRGYGNNSRDRHGRVEDYDHSYSRRHSSYHDRNFQNSVHARADYSRHDDGRYARRSPERSARERNAGDSGYRRRENRDRDERVSDARTVDRDRVREEEADVRDRHKSKDREARHGQERYGEKYRDCGSDVEVGHGKRIDSGTSCKDANAVEGRDSDVDKLNGREELKPKPDTEKSKEKESRRREREDGKDVEGDKVDGDHRRNRDKGHKGHGEHRRMTLPSSENKGYSSDEPEGFGELTRERSHGQGHSKKGDKDKKYSGEKGRSKFSSSEPTRGVHDSGATSDHLDDTKKLDDKFIKGSKWGPEADNPDSIAASSDPEVAKLAAMKAAALVNINLGGLKSVDEKKKMLWGSKDQKPAVASGTNRWDTVQFADRDRQEKFNKLMSLSVLSYLYPNVGCQRRRGRRWRREFKQFVHNRKARRATARSGKAVHCRPAETGWSDCWIGPVISNLCFTSMVFTLEMWIDRSRKAVCFTKHRFIIACCKVRSCYEDSLYKLCLQIYVLVCVFF